MSNTDRDHLERALTEMTRWEGQTPELWRRALEAEVGGQPADDAEAAEQPRLKFHRLRLNTAPLAAAAMVLIAVAIGVALLPGLPRAGQPTQTAVRSAPSAPQPEAPQLLADGRSPAEPELARQLRYQEGEWVMRSGGRAEESAEAQAEAQVDALAHAPARRARAAGEIGTRHIARRATIELHTDDVRAIFAQAVTIPTEARGEYVQASTLSGEGETARAEITLRITAQRLDDAMSELRALADVHSERTTADDMTTQVVDLEARLRNERRIERELAELLDKRADAPLSEIMEVRSSLDDVRQRIERLSAQQENLSRSTALATIVIIIRTPANDADGDPAPGALRDYFRERIESAWYAGTRSLADSTGVLLTIVIGGLVWWVPAAAGAGYLIQRRRSTIARGRM